MATPARIPALLRPESGVRSIGDSTVLGSAWPLHGLGRSSRLRLLPRMKGHHGRKHQSCRDKKLFHAPMVTQKAGDFQVQAEIEDYRPGFL